MHDFASNDYLLNCRTAKTALSANNPNKPCYWLFDYYQPLRLVQSVFFRDHVTLLKGISTPTIWATNFSR